jgi:hypothetical protein
MRQTRSQKDREFEKGDKRVNSEKESRLWREDFAERLEENESSPLVRLTRV